jgi:hypothetical protein
MVRFLVVETSEGSRTKRKGGVDVGEDMGKSTRLNSANILNYFFS